MQPLDLQVIEQALQWSAEGRCIWLCSVLSTFGSSPRMPGAMLVVNSAAQHVGSLSGGCIEEDFVDRVQRGEFDQSMQIIRYGDADDNPQVILPCGGCLEILVEKLSANAATQQHLNELKNSLMGHNDRIRFVDMANNERGFSHCPVQGVAQSSQVAIGTDQIIRIRVGASARLIIAGMSSITPFCAQYAQSLGFEVIICDPREGAFNGNHLSGIHCEPTFPASFIQREGNVHGNTAIVAVTHDPRMDDLTMMEAVNTPAFYLGVMGSTRTSQQREERLIRVGGLNRQQIASIHMPIGLNIGSKTPAEIALSVMADILRVQRGISRDDL